MSNNEDRRYFRIEDTLGLQYRIISEDEAKALKESGAFNDLPQLDLISELDNQIQLLASRVKIKSQEMAELAMVLNKKMDFILTQLNTYHAPHMSTQYELTPVDISACGLAFPCQEKLTKNTLLELSLILKPTNQLIKLLGRVVSSQKSPESQSSKPYIVRLDFDDISENIQEILIQHIVKRQGTLIKQMREKKLVDQG